MNHVTMPIDVVINGKTQHAKMKNGHATIHYTGATPPVIDPDGWVLRAQ